MLYLKEKKKYLFTILITFFLFIPSKTILAKISDKNAIKTYWVVQPIIPGAAKYFIRTEKLEKKTKVLNNHPFKISPDVLRRLLKQLAYKYDRSHPEIPVFSPKELELLTEYVPKALATAKSNEDITFVIKGPHSSQRWSFKEDRLTAGRIFIANNQLNLILGAVQLGLQPTLAERYEGNVWETAKISYDVGKRRKKADYEGLIVIYDQSKKGIYRKSNERKDWFVFTNTAYKQAKDSIVDSKSNSMSKEQYKTLQQQIDTLQKQLNQPSPPKKRRSVPPPQTQRKRSNETYKEKKQTTNQGNPSVIEQRLKTIENLHKKGILSEEEYQKKRSEILKGI